MGPQVMGNFWVIGKILMRSQCLLSMCIQTGPVKIYDFVSCGFPTPVEFQNVVPLAQSAMRKCSTGNNKPVATKHIGF